MGSEAGNGTGGSTAGRGDPEAQAEKGNWSWPRGWGCGRSPWHSSQKPGPRRRQWLWKLQPQSREQRGAGGPGAGVGGGRSDVQPRSHTQVKSGGPLHTPWPQSSKHLRAWQEHGRARQALGPQGTPRHTPFQPIISHLHGNAITSDCLFHGPGLRRRPCLQGNPIARGNFCLYSNHVSPLVICSL